MIVVVVGGSYTTTGNVGLCFSFPWDDADSFYHRQVTRRMIWSQQPQGRRRRSRSRRSPRWRSSTWMRMMLDSCCRRGLVVRRCPAAADATSSSLYGRHIVSSTGRSTAEEPFEDAASTTPSSSSHGISSITISCCQWHGYHKWGSLSSRVVTAHSNTLPPSAAAAKSGQDWRERRSLLAPTSPTPLLLPSCCCMTH